jgi:hypothetical protein
MAVPSKQIQFHIKNAKEVVREVGKDLDKSIDYAMKRFADDLKEELIKEMVRMDAIAFGRMKRGLMVDITWAVNKITLRVFNKQPYMKFVDSGTSKHYPPISPIKKWVKKKFGGDKRDAYAIQKSIAKKGTKKKPFVTDTMLKYKPRAKKIILRYIKMKYKQLSRSK